LYDGRKIMSTKNLHLNCSRCQNRELCLPRHLGTSQHNYSPL
jgi:hypothetical protein